jgi:hypothetical protein
MDPCFSWPAILAAPHTAPRCTPTGADALDIVAKRVSSARGAGAERIVTDAIDWLLAAQRAGMLSDCDVEGTLEEWLCLETELQGKGHG